MPSDNDTTQHAHEQERAKRSGEGLFGFTPGCEISTRSHAEEGQAERGGQAERSEKEGSSGVTLG
jgi:hypothetical protein